MNVAASILASIAKVTESLAKLMQLGEFGHFSPLDLATGRICRWGSVER